MADRHVARFWTRRALLGKTLLAASAPISPANALAAPGSSVGPGTSSRDESPTLTLAMLQSHWETIEPMVEEYGAVHGVAIDAQPLEYEELYSQLSLALTQQSSSFDVVSLDDPWIPQFASFLAPLDLPADAMNAFVPIAASLSAYPEGTRPCALPWIGNAQFLGLRPRWLQESGEFAPATWDEALATATNIASMLGPDADQWAFAISTLTPHELVLSFLPILGGFGKTIIDPKTSVPQLDTPEANDAMDMFLSLAQLSPEESGAVGAPTNSDRFEAGLVTMMSNIWSTNWLAAGSEDQPEGAGPIEGSEQPAQQHATRQTMTGVWLLGVPLGSAQPDRAMELVRWLSGPDAQAQLPTLTLPPSRQGVYDDPRLTTSLPILPRLHDLLAMATPRPRSPFYPQLEQLLAAELAHAFSGEKSGAQALKDANIAIREFLVREGVLSV